MTLTDRLKQRARDLGFTLAGITAPDPPPHTDFYEHWLAAGHHGPLAYLATDRARRRRADPRKILPGCQSILVLATNYAPPHPDPPHRKNTDGEPRERGGAGACPERSRRGWGRVAAYARNRDYHDVLLPRMDALVAWLENEVGHPVAHKRYTDTGPILERELAQRAGLGWIGKNTCLIHPRAGSYLLLSEIFLDLPLDPDPPFLPDHCGTCTRCIEACPTACILPDRTLDAGRCISTLTIELKGAIPRNLRPQMGNRVFGCDVCQQVCPWNRLARPTGDPDFTPGARSRKEEEGKGVDLLTELALTPEEFRRKFRGSPVKRAKRRGYLRNVAVALGNTGDPAAVPTLTAALRDEEPLVRAHAAWALGQIGGEAARTALETAARTEGDPDVLAEIKLCHSERSEESLPCEGETLR